MTTISVLKCRMASTARWMMVLEDGLNGTPHSLGKGDADAMGKALEKLGVRLLSRTKAGTEGL